MASGSSGMQDVLHSPPSVLCHHKLGYHDLQHRALHSYLPCHVVCLQPEGKGTPKKRMFDYESIMFLLQD